MLDSVVRFARHPLFAVVFSALISFLTFARPATGQERLAHCMEGRREYIESVLLLALSYSNKRYTIDDLGSSCTQPRQVEGIVSGTLSFMWGGTTRELEERLYPLRFPLFKGLLGHRIFIIRRGDQHLFDQVDTLEELRRIKLGQGRMWSDTQILEAAGMTVVKTNAYQNLFPMLEGGRFDAFPRGANEPWTEIAQWSDLDLVVEKTLAIVYPMPAYIFVSRDNTALIRDLEYGFEQAIQDGSFDRNFYADSEIQNVLARANLKTRKIFRVENPFLSPETPLDRNELWLNIADLPDTRVE